MRNQDRLLSDKELLSELMFRKRVYKDYTDGQDFEVNGFMSKHSAQELVNLINTQKRLYSEAQFKTEFRELLEKLDAYNFAHTLAIVIFMKTMENTNATDATFTLEGFNQNGVVLGDMVIKASLRAESED